MHPIFMGAKERAQQFVQDNATTILTAGGVVGTVGTGVLAWRGGYRTAEKINENSFKPLDEDPKKTEIILLTKTEKVVLALPEVAPPILTGGATIAAIVMAQRMNASKAAALAAAYGVSQKHLEEYKAKIQEKLTGPKAAAVRDEIQQKRVDETAPKTKDVIIIGSGEVMCYDSWSGRYFKSSVEAIRKAENAVHREIMNTNEAPLRTFYDELKLMPVSMDNELGWNIQHPMSVHISSVLTPDESEPCIAIEFTEYPIMGYTEWRRHG